MAMNPNSSSSQLASYAGAGSAYSGNGVRPPMSDPGTTFNPQDRNVYEAFAVRRDGSESPKSLGAYNLGSSTAKPQVNAPVKQVGG